MMACMPEIILMDEPYSAMDESLKREMQREMSVFLKRYKGNLIFVSHSREEVYRFGREIAVIHDGKVLRMDGRDAILNSPEVFRRPGWLALIILKRAEKRMILKSWFQLGGCG